MKIGINGQMLLIDQPAGPEKYTYNLINSLAKIDHENQYVLFFNKNPGKDYFDKLTYYNSSFTSVLVESKISWTQVGLARELHKRPIDLFFTAVHTMPIFKPQKLKIVGMIHGLEYRFSKKTLNPIKNWLLGKPEWYLTKYSDALIVPTSSVKDEIVKKGWLDRDNPKISVINEGVSDIFYKRDETEVSNIRKKYNLGNSRYLLYVSTIQPRKNIPGMVAAYADAINKNPDLKDTKMLIVGKAGWDYEESLNSPKKYNVEKNVLFLGRLPDEELPPLFSGALGYINVSLEEGFGLPLLEAMACETPTLVSNLACFKEIGEELPLYVRPTDIDEISNSIALLFHGGYKKEKISPAKARAQKFTWINSAQKTLDVFKQVAKNL